MYRRLRALSWCCRRLELAVELLHRLQAVASPLISSLSLFNTIVVSSVTSVELQEFSLGSCPPSVGLQGMRWSTIVDQRVLKLGLDWDTNEMSILMFAKLAKPLIETVGIVINSLHIKLLFTPILDGNALLYSFVS
ncbi:hypothetical protein S83_070505 [Arachis hypogaea]